MTHGRIRSSYAMGGKQMGAVDLWFAPPTAENLTLNSAK